MNRRGRHPLWGSRDVLALASMVAVAGIVHGWSPIEAVALPLYALPVLFAAVRGGRRGGTHVLVLVVGAIVGIGTIARPESGALVARWVPIASWIAFAIALVWAVGGVRDRARRRAREVRDAHLAFRDALVQLVAASSGHQDEGLERMAEQAVDLARALAADRRACDDIHAAALLSPLATSDTTVDVIARVTGLATPGRRRDPAPLARPEDGFLERVASILACMHERWDGGGRLGLAGDAIPFGARVLAVADAFDTAVHGRRDTGTHGGVPAAVAHLRGLRGVQFDPAIVDAFLKMHAPEADIPELRFVS